MVTRIKVYLAKYPFHMFCLVCLTIVPFFVHFIFLCDSAFCALSRVHMHLFWTRSSKVFRRVSGPPREEAAKEQMLDDRELVQDLDLVHFDHARVDFCPVRYS